MINSEWNAIGNPYTAYIPANENGGANFIEDNISIFDPTYVAVYMWDANQNKYVANSLVSGARSIAPGQGFFIHTGLSVSSVTFKESLRSVQNTGGVFNRGIKQNSSIELTVRSESKKVHTNIIYKEDATLGLDSGFDLGNFDGADFDVYTHLVNGETTQNFTFQSLPKTDIEKQIIPIGLTARSGETIIFSANRINLPKGVEVYLEDKALNEFVKLDATATYKVSTKEQMNGVGRFYLHTKSEVLTVPNSSIENIKLYNSNSTLIVEGIQGNNFDITVYNTLGAILFTSTYKGIGKNQIELPKAEVGGYIVRLATEYVTKKKKIIIKNKY